MATAPASVHRHVESLFAHVSPWQADAFATRLNTQWPIIEASLLALYPEENVPDIALRLVETAARHFVQRPADLHALDHRRTMDPHWLQSPSMIGYAAYTERFGGTLQGVEERVDYLKELGVTYLHLMPLLKPRPGDSDGGYAVANYREVRSDLGTMEDLEHLAATLRANGISLVTDLVLNHVAIEHEWAQRARSGQEKYRNYFYMFPDRTVPNAFEKSLPEVFPEFAPGNFTWDQRSKSWVWTTFNRWQWDLNWTNPDVMLEYADIMLFLANKGVEVLRLDALAFLWKRMGTTCQNQPEVHAITAALRAVARLTAPGVAFKAEAIVGPHDLVQYLGLGSHEGLLSDLAYHNTWMVHLWSMLAAQDTTLAVHTLRNLPTTPAGGTWITYARCHDDIGWAIDDEDAAAVGVSGPLHRAFLSDWYAGDAGGSTSDGLVFQANPETGDRRISGTMASLTGASETYNADLSRAGIERVKTIVAATYGFGGIPVIWSGDELAMPNDPDWAADGAHAADNRWTHRPVVTDAALATRHRPGTPAAEIFEWHCTVATVRASLPQLDSAIQPEVLPVANPGVLAIGRRSTSGDLVQLYNVTGDIQTWPAEWLRGFSVGGKRALLDALTGAPVRAARTGTITLAPWSRLWIVAPR